MDINEWEVWYAEILETLGFSREGDEKTADLLDEILDKKGEMNDRQEHEVNHRIRDDSRHRVFPSHRLRR